MEQLLVRLGSFADDPVHWLVWSSSENEIIASGVLPDAGALNTLTERAGQRPVIALAPTSDILLKWVNLPPRAGRKVLSALPFMLEDELAQDISHQFFALGPKEGERQAVAVVTKDKMQQWQDWLHAANLFCDTLIPDVLAVPQNPDGWSAISLGEQLLLREDAFKGLQGEADWILPVFAHHTKQQETPVGVVSYSEIDFSQVPNINVDTSPLELPMHVLAKEAMGQKFNLFQGDYKIKKQRSGVFQQWRVAAVLAILALTTSLVDKGMTLYQLEAQNDALKNQIDAAVKAGFPDIGAYRDVKRKVQAEMARLEAGGGSASMLVMLDQLTNAFAQSKVKPQTLRFDSARTEIRMQAVGKNFEALEVFRRQAESMGFTVEQGAINNRDDEVIGSVLIRSQS